jgi:hypothetical protein
MVWKAHRGVEASFKAGASVSTTLTEFTSKSAAISTFSSVTKKQEDSCTQSCSSNDPKAVRMSMYQWVVESTDKIEPPHRVVRSAAMPGWNVCRRKSATSVQLDTLATFLPTSSASTVGAGGSAALLLLLLLQ